MGEFFETAQTEKSSGSLDGVNGAKDFGDGLGRAAAQLQLANGLLHTVQAFVAF